MCGLAALFAYGTNAPPIDRTQLDAIHDRQAPRGPDSEGVWISDDNRIAIAHRRLSIIDLSDAGAQPMVSPDGAYRIVYNGEIYNYRALRQELIDSGVELRSNSDTEVLLHLYMRKGPAMVDSLRGMFAFAIWDETRRGIFMARDAYGIKPLYFADNGNTLRVASQVKALVAGGSIDTSPNPAGHVGFFMLGYVPEPHTLYKGIQAIPAGGSLWVDTSGRGAPHRWFDITKELRDVEPAPYDAEKLRAALVESMQHHLVADVPVGVFLSAGLDSASLVALASEQHGANLRTVTLGFKQFRGTENDEAPLAEVLAKHYETSHETCWIETEDFRANADALMSAMDQPSIDGANTYFVSKVTREAGLKVALSGVGGDELFAGYQNFRQVPKLARGLGIFRYLPGLGKAIRIVSAPLIKKLTSPKYAGLFEYGSRLGDAYLLRRGLYMPWELTDLLDPDLVREGLESLAMSKTLSGTIEGITSDRVSMTALESAWYMRNQLLRDSDWASMAHSLEIRTPLVDITLLRTLAPMLAGPRPPMKNDMAISLAKPLPDEILSRPKTGFSIPVRDWVGGEKQATRGGDYRDWARYIYDRQWPGSLN
ncbi:MAG: asparagine synthase (glutamine-hydrolyzing) [Rhodospirillaceae bacterium]|nr:asparagine synthase (glutamine-hydrolyzing) [Rhodospirillaceae bacterium]|tara:strand:- start:17612 stop:19402 length:1791 start_codon:yes stop_codon:yes gene_type:complete